MHLGATRRGSARAPEGPSALVRRLGWDSTGRGAGRCSPRDGGLPARAVGPAAQSLARSLPPRPPRGHAPRLGHRPDPRVARRPKQPVAGLAARRAQGEPTPGQRPGPEAAVREGASVRRQRLCAPLAPGPLRLLGGLGSRPGELEAGRPGQLHGALPRPEASGGLDASQSGGALGWRPHLRPLPGRP